MASVREIVQPDPESDRRFNAVVQLSKINLGLYRQFLQPWVRHTFTPQAAQWLQAMHPLRVSYEWWSDHNPLAPQIAEAAIKVREQRVTIDEDNPFLQMQRIVSKAITQTLDQWRDMRDSGYERAFEWIYDSPWMRILAGQTGSDEPARAVPCTSVDHTSSTRAFISA